MNARRKDRPLATMGRTRKESDKQNENPD